MIESDPVNADAPSAEDESACEAESLDAAVRALRRFVARHNWQALTLSFFSLAAAAILWGLIYIFIYWFTLVGVSVARSWNLETISQINDPNLINAQFPWWFLLVAGLLMIVAGLVRHKVRAARLREAQQYLLWVVVELLMSVPGVTFSIWGNLSALVRLRKSDAAAAWALLERINDQGGRLNVTSLRLVIEDERVLQHVMFALQIVGLIDLRERRDGWFICLQNREAFALLQRADIGK